MTTPRVLQAELTHVYRDPIVGPRDIMAYVPEMHASANCQRALARGERIELAGLTDLTWCDVCTTDKPEQATLRRQPDGTWSPVEVTSDPQ